MAENTKVPVCGIVMPISEIDGCSENHWTEVLSIITDAITDANFGGSLVSHADEATVIHKTIIQNLYDNPIVVCDVSGKNPNVMFELGLRLAFDKPTIIIKDDKTPYSFDTSAIEHIEYPRDLRFSQIVTFKKKLTEKIVATHKKAASGTDYTTFLKNFGEFKVAKIEKREVSGQEYILEELKSLKLAVNRLDRNTRYSNPNVKNIQRALPIQDLDICLEGYNENIVDQALTIAKSHPNILAAQLTDFGDGHPHLSAELMPGSSKGQVRDSLIGMIEEIRSAQMSRHSANRHANQKANTKLSPKMEL